MNGRHWVPCACVHLDVVELADAAHVAFGGVNTILRRLRSSAAMCAEVRALPRRKPGVHFNLEREKQQIEEAIKAHRGH